jgi:uncharacterized protein
MKYFIYILIPLILSACGRQPESEKYVIGTGAETGVYYPVGIAIRDILREEGSGLPPVEVLSSDGSIDNIRNVLSGELTFGLAQADNVYQAAVGLGAWFGPPREELYAVFSLHHEILTLMAGTDSGIHTLEDLRGKRVDLGVPGSGHRENAIVLLREAGLQPHGDLDARSLEIQDVPDAIQKGEIDAFFYGAGHPNQAIELACRGSRTLRFIPLTGFEDILEDAPYFSMTRVPTSLYPEAEQGEVPSIGMLTVMITHRDVPEQAVYQLVKTVFENLDTLRTRHPALRNLTPEELIQGLQAPLHPGAARYYREAGLLPPENTAGTL